jgi:hypothetical protein
MQTLEENRVIKFKNITKKKEGIFANFKVKSMRNGVHIAASLSVDISALELHPGDSIEKIVEQCARLALAELKKSDFQFEAGSEIDSYLGVAQLG